MPPECPPEVGVEYVIFADVPVAYEHAGWQIRPPVYAAKMNRRRARLHKVQPHLLFPDADFTLWLDGTLTPITSLRALVDEYAPEPDVHVVTFAHPKRSCLYDEADELIRRRRDNAQTIRAQVERYRQEGYPAGNGLASTSAVLRRNSSTARRLDELWRSEIQRGSFRDQVSFDYCLWKVGLPARYFRGVHQDNPHFRRRRHSFAKDNPQFRWKPAA